MKCLVNEELSVSKQAHKLIKMVAMKRCDKNQILIFSEPFLTAMKEMGEADTDALKLRFIELMVEISTIDQEYLERYSLL